MEFSGSGGSFDSGIQGVGSPQGAQGRTGEFFSAGADVGLLGAWSGIVPVWSVEISQ